MSDPETFLTQAIRDGHARRSGSGKSETISYLAVDSKQRYSDPEEKVRAEFWAELIYVYGYEPSFIGVEVTVPDRTPSDHADLVVFRDPLRTRPYAVVECKRDDVTDAEFDQAVEQAVGNGTWAKFRADYVMVVAGSTRRVLDFTGRYGVLEREENIVADLPRSYGTPEEFKYTKGGPLDIRRVSKSELIATIRKCHQSLWGGGKLSPPAAFGELSKLIFVKVSDEQTGRLPGEPYSFQIKTHESSHRLAQRINELYRLQRERDPEVFNEPIKVDPTTLRTVVSHLEGINLSATDLDTKGVAFEQFMDRFFKGDFGQYFTPREIIDFVIQMISPRESERVLDPACGSGGFLLHALDYVRRSADGYFEAGTPEHFRFWHDFARSNLFGVEINEEIARVAKMNMILHDDGHSNVIARDALEPIERLRERNLGFSPESFDIVLTNPPFGAQVLLAERPYLGQYELGSQRSTTGTKARKAQKTEILFLERIWEFLKPGTGRAGVVVPDGVLTNASQQYVRDFLLEHFQLLAVVSLPTSAFAHFGTAVKASLMFLRKRALDELPEEDELIFMAAPALIGYDATGRKTDSELPLVLADYQRFIASPQEFTMEATSE